MGWNGLDQGLTQTRVWQDEVVVSLKENEGLDQSGFALTRRGAASPDRRHSLPQAQIEPFHHSRVDRTAASRQYLIDRRFRAEYDPGFDLNKAPSPHGLRGCFENPRDYLPRHLCENGLC